MCSTSGLGYGIPAQEGTGFYMFVPRSLQRRKLLRGSICSICCEAEQQKDIYSEEAAAASVTL